MIRANVIAFLKRSYVSGYARGLNLFRVNVLSKLCTFEVEFPVSSPTGFEFPKNGPNPGFGTMNRVLNPTHVGWDLSHMDFISVYW